MTLHDTILSVREPSARSDAAYAPTMDTIATIRRVDCTPCKWRPMPGELVSLWDMLRTYAHIFVALSNTLSELEVFHAELHRSLSQNGQSASQNDLETHCASLRKMLHVAHEALAGMGLNVSASQVRDVNESLSRNLQSDAFKSSIGQLRRLIEYELESRLFLHVPQNRAEYWSEEPLLSKKAQRSFKKAIDDMVEAGKCLAVGRYTASVFHLMRVVEVGAKRFARKFPGLTLSHKATLGSIAKDISCEILLMPNGTPSESERKEAFSRTADHLSHITAGWRNKTMHPGLSYNEEQATLMFKNVREFMQLLADLK